MARWGAIAAILLTPLIAMRFTDEVDWDTTDFAFVGGLLIGAGLIYELATWKARKAVYRAGVGVTLLIVVAVIWVDAAAGLF